MSHTGEKQVDPLILTIFPGDSGATRVYEDESNTLGYKQTAYAWTTVKHSRASDGVRKIEILPVEGNYPGMRTERGYEIRLPGSWPPESVTYNGKTLAYSRETVAPGWSYDGDKLMTVISLPRTSVKDRVEVFVKVSAAEESQSQLLDGVPGRLARLRTAMAILDSTWSKGWSPDILIEGAQTGNRISIKPTSALLELRNLQRNFPEIVRAISEMSVDPETILRAVGHLGQNAKIVPVQLQPNQR
jgi:hypothetical protein